MSVKRLKRTTVAQYEELLQFVENNKILVHGKTKPQEAGIIKTLWQQFADHINSLGVGPGKTAEQWKKIYVEWKTNIRRKTREIKTEIRCTGGGTSKAKGLTDLEQRLLGLISKIHLGSEELPDSLGSQNLDISISEQDTVPSNIYTPLTSELIGEVSPISEDDFMLLDAGQILDDPLVMLETNQSLNKSFAAQNDSLFTAICKDTPALAASSSQSCFIDNANSNIIKDKHPSVAKNLNTSQRKRQNVGHEKRYTNTFIESAANSYNEAQEMRYQAAVKNADAVKSLSEAICGFTSVYKERVEVEKIKAEAEVVKAQALLIQAKSKLIKVQLDYINFFENDIDM